MLHSPPGAGSWAIADSRVWRRSNGRDPVHLSWRKRMMRLCSRGSSLAAGLAAILCLAGAARAEEPIKLTITIKDHQFIPSKIMVPAGKPSVLTIRNEDPTPEEFESPSLRITELGILGGRETTVQVRPLDPGEYPFEGEFH